MAEDTQSHQALGWVRSGIADILDDARTALMTYRSEPGNIVQLRFSITYFRQLHGALKMLELEGGMRLAAEMLSLAEHIDAHPLTDPADAVDALLHATRIFPDYLREVEQSRHDQPLKLLSGINDLRAARQQAPINELELFTPDLEVELPAGMPSPDADPDRLQAIAGRLRPVFQAGLLQWLDDRREELGLQCIGVILRELQQHSTDPGLIKLWWIGRAVIEALIDGGLQTSREVQQQVRKLDGFIATLKEQDEMAAAAMLTEQIQLSLLYQVAIADSAGPLIQSVRNAFGLADYRLNQGIEVTFHGGELRQSISQTLLEEIQLAKHWLDVAQIDGPDRQRLLELLERIGQILQLLSLPNANRLLVQQQKRLEHLPEGLLHHDDLNSMANALLQIETEILDGARDEEQDFRQLFNEQQNPVSRNELENARAALFGECLHDLAAVQYAIDSFHRSGEVVNEVRAVPALLQQLAGRLAFVGQTRCAGIIADTARCIDAGLATLDTELNDSVIERLGHTIAAVDLYLQGLAGGSSSREALLISAADSLQPLLDCLPEENNPGTSAAQSSTAVATTETALLHPHPDWLLPVSAWQRPGIANDDTLLAFLEESDEILAQLDNDLSGFSGQTPATAQLASVRRAFHTLKGSGRVVGAEHCGALSWAVEHWLNQVLDGLQELASEDVELLQAATTELRSLINLFMSGQDECPDSCLSLIAAAESRLTGAEGDTDVGERGELLRVFRNESLEHLHRLQQIVSQAQQDPQHSLSAESAPLLHTLKGSARIAGAEAIADAAGILEQRVRDHLGQSLLLDASELEQMQQATQALESFITSLETSTLVPQLPDSLTALLQQLEHPAQHGSGYDQELLVSFVEEMEEILEVTAHGLQEWMRQPGDLRQAAVLQRELHTLKGGAHLVGIEPVAALTHELETLLTPFADGLQAVRPGLFALVQQALDRLGHDRQQLETGHIPQDHRSLLVALSEFSAGLPASRQGNIKAAAPSSPPVERDNSNQIRIAVERLEALSGIGGEIRQASNRVGQDHHQLRQSLSEIADTTERLQKQLRRLELETDLNAVIRHSGRDGEDQDFDPLELDRYTQLQELSRALSESVSDLQDLQQTMLDRVRRSEVAQLQLTRSNRQLGQMLLDMRMLPFDSLLPRLQKLVQQTASDLDKQAVLQVSGSELQFDRGVLERIVAPLEHLLRNAIAHGIEAAETRRLSGKPEQGLINLHLHRSGTDIIVTLSDDGRGIDMQGIREAGIRRGLIDDKRHYSDQELLQYILASGFSTAGEISRIAGRGLGLDVVNTTIRKLGGSLQISTEAGVGSRFSLRLPTSLATTRALLVRAARHQYALPLNRIENIIRLSLTEVRALLGQESPDIDYQGEACPFHALTPLLQSHLSPGLPERPTLPVILMRPGEQLIAVLPDQIIGNREIVVKSPGGQIATLPEIAGATLTDEGQVALMLDMAVLIQRRQGLPLADSGDIVTDSPRQRPLVLVVDDSITMRKSAQNLLQRQHMDCITARDGVEAVTRLNEQLPDIILLDIEMPRMDGYEFASIVRNNARFRHLPIIMITSRTGSKHRQRAEQFGIDAYLGKPYQEGELLEHIHRLIRTVSDTENVS